MKRKVLAFFLMAVLTTSLFAGCGAKPAAGSGNAAAAESTLQKVIKTKKLVVGCILSFPPAGFKDEKGVPQGYDVELARKLAAALGAELEIVDVTADARIPSLETGKVDLVIGNFTRNLERAQKIDFTDPYVVAGERLLVRKESKIKSNADLNGKVIGVTKGSTNADLAMKVWPTSKVAYYNTSADALLALKNGQCDTFLEDSNFQTYQAKLDPALEVVGDSLIALEYNGFGLKKGDQDWLNYLNLFIFMINADGTNKALYNKFFGQDPAFSLTPQF